MEGGEREDVADVCPRLILGLTPLSFAPAGLVPSFGWSPTAYAVGCVLFAPSGLGFISALTTSDSRRGLIYRRCAAVSFLPFATHGLRRGLRSFRPLRGLFRCWAWRPTAYAVGCILSPLRGCAVAPA